MCWGAIRSVRRRRKVGAGPSLSRVLHRNIRPGRELASRTHRVTLKESTRRSNAALFGADSWLFDVQAHPPTAEPVPGTVEDGQILLMIRNP